VEFRALKNEWYKYKSGGVFGGENQWEKEGEERVNMIEELHTHV
jgi:hypothetical protein